MMLEMSTYWQTFLCFGTLLSAESQSQAITHITFIIAIITLPSDNDHRHDFRILKQKILRIICGLEICWISAEMVYKINKNTEI